MQQQECIFCVRSCVKGVKMKKRFFVTIIALILGLGLASCGKGGDESEAKKTVTYDCVVEFTYIDDETDPIITVDGCNAIYSDGEDGSSILLDLSNYGIDKNDLIPGDILRIECEDNGKDASHTDILPGTIYLNAAVKKVEHIKADICTVRIKITGEQISFEPLDGKELKYTPNYVITKKDGKLSSKTLIEYEDGMTLYYAYSKELKENLVSKNTYFYDYNPRSEAAD